MTDALEYSPFLLKLLKCINFFHYVLETNIHHIHPLYHFQKFLLVVFPQCRNLLKLPWNGVDFPGHNFPLCHSPTVGISQGWVMWIPLVKVTTDITHVVKTSFNFRNHSALYKELLVSSQNSFNIFMFIKSLLFRMNFLFYLFQILDECSLIQSKFKPHQVKRSKRQNFLPFCLEPPNTSIYWRMLLIRKTVSQILSWVYQILNPPLINFLKEVLMGFYSLLCVHVLLSYQFLCFLQPFTDDTFIFPEIMPTANSILKFQFPLLSKLCNSNKSLIQLRHPQSEVTSVNSFIIVYWFHNALEYFVLTFQHWLIIQCSGEEGLMFVQWSLHRLLPTC